MRQPGSVFTGWAYIGLLSLILLASGYCSLAYQVVWIREFRLIFGGTTGAMAAVLAVFMGGLGVGSTVIGRRVAKSAQPLYFYALLELGICFTVKLSPTLLDAVRDMYLGLGGEVKTGYGLATVMRLGMTAMVIGLPCFLMGGTLPAVARHLQHDRDPGRKITGWLYGVNLAGALLGVAVTVFVTLEYFGNRGSLHFAVGVNLAIGLLALVLSRVKVRESLATDEEDPGEKGVSCDESSLPQPEPEAVFNALQQGIKVPPSLCLLTVFLTGLVFFMLELLWYRVSVPLTGGSVYALGMVLLVALAGLALGGGLYALAGKRIANRPGAMALLGALQIFFVLLPYCIGDYYAWLVAWGIHRFENPGWSEMFALWFAVVAGIALIPSIIAGLQFPLLLSMLGKGSRDISVHLGDAYGWNTLGAITGSILGGFVLLPLLGAERLWLLLAGICLLPTFLFLALHFRLDAAKSKSSGLRSLGIAIVVIMLPGVSFACAFFLGGPGAYWRHGAIGFGRIDPFPRSWAGCREVFAGHELAVRTEKEGREAGIAVLETNSRSLVNNGKSDGSVHADAATNIGLSLIPALVHGKGVKSAAVIGAGTGMSAGWLASFPGVEKVDLLEIEPRVVEFLNWFAPLNLDPLANPIVEVHIGDARETLATRAQTYDVIVSQPSNLNRGGICDFYTLEYYQRVMRRLHDGGIFCQWVQAYQLDASALQQVAVTMLQVFPRVELWVPSSGDVIFLGSLDAEPYNLQRIRERLQHSAYRRAMIRGFHTDAAEGLFARFVADSETLRRGIPRGVVPNTDSRNVLEFRVARQSLLKKRSSVRNWLAELFAEADMSRAVEGYLPTARLKKERVFMHAEDLERFPKLSSKHPWLLQALSAFGQNQFLKVRRLWLGRPESLMGKLYVAMTSAVSPGPFEEELDAIRSDFPAETELLLGLRVLHEGRSEWGMGLLEKGLGMQQDMGWADQRVTKLVIDSLMRLLPLMNRTELSRLFKILERSFPCGLEEDRRRQLRLNIAWLLDPEHKRQALEAYGDTVLSMGVPSLVAAQIPERRDAREAIARYYRGGGKIPESYMSQSKPGPGLGEASRPILELIDELGVGNEKNQR